MNAEHEALDALTRSEGWAAFCQHVEREWGTPEHGGSLFQAAVTKAADVHADADAMAQLRQIVAAQKAIHKLMAWVPERLKALASSEPKLFFPAQQSRRGGL